MIPRVSERRGWTAPLINWVVRESGPFPSYYRRFRIKPLPRFCPFCSFPGSATVRHISVECVRTQPLRKRHSPRLSIDSVRKLLCGSKAQEVPRGLPERGRASSLVSRPFLQEVNISLFISRLAVESRCSQE